MLVALNHLLKNSVFTRQLREMPMSCFGGVGGRGDRVYGVGGSCFSG